MLFFAKFLKETHYTCPICFDNIKNTITTKCNHIFCNSCLNKWLDNNNSCPLCRTIIRGDVNMPPLQAVQFRVIYNYKQLEFIGTLVSITHSSENRCYKFINIEQSTYPIGDTVFVFDNMATIQRI